MTHNRFNVEEDLIKPLLKFLHACRLDLACYDTVDVSLPKSESDLGFLKESSLGRLLHQPEQHEILGRNTIETFLNPGVTKPSLPPFKGPLPD